MKLVHKMMSEPILAALSLGLTVVLLTTRNAEMSDMTATMILGFFTLAVLAYSAFVFKENPADEREYELSLVASKYAYLVGSAILSLGIILQTLDHSLEPWLPIALAGMVITKSLAYFTKK